MKVKIILFITVLSTLSIKGFSKNKDQKQEDKKSVKSKYDFNIFKLFAINKPNIKSDSTKTALIKSAIIKEY